MELRLADLDDAEDVVEMLAKASAWLRARGIQQWPERFPIAQIAGPIERGETWLASRDGAIVGTLTLSRSDALVWPDAPDDALYVHRLAVCRLAAGTGLELLRWAERAAAAERREFMRLDCWNENRALRDYYEAAGYEHRGDTDEFTWTLETGETRGWAVSRYEKRVRDPTG